MKYSDADIRRSLENRAMRGIEPLGKALLEVDGMFLHAGHGGGSSRWEVVRMQRLREQWHELCDAVAVTLAEITGADAPHYAHLLHDALASVELTVMFTHGRQSRGPNPPADYEEQLAATLARIRDNVVHDLRMGIADGKNVAKHFVVNVDNRHATAPQTAIGNSNQQTIGNVTIGTDPASLAELVGQLRQQFAQVPLPAEQADEVEDALVVVEREAEQQQPNPGRIRRALGVVRNVAESVGVKAAAELIFKFLKETL